MSGIISIVSTTIGNNDDISHRALQTLAEADIIVCEEFKIGASLLKKHSIEAKELINYNEHNKESRTSEIIGYIKSGKKLALISDCGTPVFSDPGFEIVRECIQRQLKVTAVPGASSLMTAISLSPIAMDKFHFEGWLSQKRELREQRLRELKQIKYPIILMDTPYRLLQLLSSVDLVLGKDTLVFIACDLTMETERLFFGKISKIIGEIKVLDLKAEYVCIIKQDK